SSRRRHTRFSRDWSSDVCSSDLVLFVNVETTYLGSNVNRQDVIFEGSPNVGDVLQVGIRNNPGGGYQWYSFTVTPIEEGNLELRSEERRVGKESRSRG